MQCGPLASRETTATSQGRARYAAATQPHGSPSSASSSKMVPVGLTELMDAAGTAITLTSDRHRVERRRSPAPTAIPGPAIGLDSLSVCPVPFFGGNYRKIRDFAVMLPLPCRGAALTPAGDTDWQISSGAGLAIRETAQPASLTGPLTKCVPHRHILSQ